MTNRNRIAILSAILAGLVLLAALAGLQTYTTSYVQADDSFLTTEADYDYEQYFYYRIGCVRRDRSYFTDWMDERISNVVTIESQVQLSCDTLEIILEPIYFDYAPDAENDRRSIVIERQGDVSDGSGEYIDWQTNYTVGWADRYDLVNGVYRRARKFTWSDSWNDGKWLVRWYPEVGEKSRTCIIYVDANGETHTFVVVPWMTRGE